MSNNHIPQLSAKFEIQAYKRPTNIHGLRKTHVPFTGSPRRHPYDAKKVCLISDPYSTSLLYYEFATQDIAYAEELANIVDIDGETITMARVWIKKGAVALRSTPFVVAEFN